MTAAAAAWSADGQGAPVRGEAVGLDVDGIALQLWRAVGIEQFVDADIAYEAGAEAALVATLAASVAPRGVVWLADSVNTARGSVAARLEAAGFAVESRQMREWEDGRAVWVRVLAARRRA